MKTLSKSNRNSLVVIATKAANQIRSIESSLRLEDVTDAELERATRYKYLPTDTLGITASFLKQHGEKFRQFDATEAQRAYDYEASMGELAAAARQLADRIDRSVLKNRFVAIPKALSLYAALQAVKRTDGSVRDVVDRLQPIVSTLKGGHRRRKAAAPAPSPTPHPVTPSPTSTSPSNGASVSNGTSVTNGGAASNGSALTNGAAR